MLGNAAIAQGAYEAGMQPEWNEQDQSYHLGSRDPRTGRILKKFGHPTYYKALEEDAKMGYKTYVIGNNTYTWHDKDGVFVPWQNQQTEEDIPKYGDGTDQIGKKEIQWFKDWYNKRVEYAIANNRPDIIKQLESLQYNFYPEQYKYSLGVDWDDSIYTGTLDPRINGVKISINDQAVKDYEKKHGVKIGGYQHPSEGIVLPSNYNSNDLLHELAHTFNQTGSVTNAVNSAISDENGFVTIPEGLQNPEYWISPWEVHSRLMQFREENNIDPTKVYNEEDIKQLRKSAKDKILFEIFNDSQMMHLLNDVADNATIPADDRLFLKNGGVVPKYGGGTNSVDDESNTSGVKTVFTTDGNAWRKRPTQEMLDTFYSGDVKRQIQLAEQAGQTVTYTNPEYTLDEVVVTAKDPNKYTELNLAKDVASFIPVIGDAMDIYDLGKSVYNGNYAQAAMLGAGLLLPNWLEKSGKLLKRIWKGNGKTVFPSDRLRFIRSDKDVNKDLFNAQFDLQKYLQSDDVQNRMKFADHEYGTSYKKNGDYIDYKISNVNPNIDYENSLFLPSELTSKNNINAEYIPAFKRFSFNPAIATKEELSNTLHHETQHFLDDISGGVEPLQNRFLLSNYTTLTGIKSLPRLYFDYGLKNIITKPIKTAKSALRDKFYLSKPTRAYFSKNVFKPRYENGISFNLPFSEEELANKKIQNILLSQKDNGTELLRLINKYGFKDGGEVQPDTIDPVDMYNKTRYQLNDIPINDKPLSGTDPIGEAVMWGIGGGIASSLIKRGFPRYGGLFAGAMFGDDGKKDNMLVVPKDPSKSNIPVAKNVLNQEVKDYYATDVIPRDVIHTDNQSFITDENFVYNILPNEHFNPGVAGYYDRLNDRIAINNSYATDKNTLDNVMSHEVDHIYNNQYPLDKQHNKILNSAYTVQDDNISRAARSARKSSEKRATNKNLRHSLYTELKEQLGHKPTVKELDEFIDSIPDQELLDRLYRANSYGAAYVMSIEDRAELQKTPVDQYKKTRVSKIRKALKRIAMNEDNSEDIYNNA